MNKTFYQGQEVLFLTYLPRTFGTPKPYFFMKDGDGTIYLTKAKRKAPSDTSVDGQTSIVNVLETEYVPDFS